MSSQTPVVGSSAPSNGEGNSFTYDPNFNGPVKKRSCTDIICLFVLLSFIAGWAVIAYYGFTNGNPAVLMYPTDSEGNICGLNLFKSRPYLYFFDLTACASPKVVVSGCSTPQVCVSKCPNISSGLDLDMPDSVLELSREHLICKYEADLRKPVRELIEKKLCATQYLRSQPLVRRCIPEVLLYRGEEVLDVKTNEVMRTESGSSITREMIEKMTRFLSHLFHFQDLVEKVLHDLRVTWHLILIMLVGIMAVNFIWIALMRVVAGVMVWLSIFATLLFLAYAFYFSCSSYIEMKNKPESDVSMAFTLNLKSYANSKNTWLAFAIITGVLFVVLLLVLIFLRKRIKIAIALIKEGSKAVACMPSTLLFPILPYIVQLLAVSFWVAVTLYIASSTKAVFYVRDAESESGLKNGSTCDPSAFNHTAAKCLFGRYTDTSSMHIAQIYNFFGLLWSQFFIIGIGQVALASAFSTYYWVLHKSKDVPSFAIMTGFYNTLRYHLGSVAVGSFLIATMRFIRAVIEYADHKCKKYQNPVTKAILWIMRCCFWCLEQFLKFISKNAYIMIAIYGKNFCTSARMAFELLLRNVARVFVLDRVTAFLLFIGKLAIVCLSATVSYYVFSGKLPVLKSRMPEMNYFFFPVMVVTFGAFVIAQVFFSVYSMAVDTLFLCFLEDLERNDGSPEKPYFMSKQLMKILDKKNKYREPKL